MLANLNVLQPPMPSKIPHSFPHLVATKWMFTWWCSTECIWFHDWDVFPLGVIPKIIGESLCNRFLSGLCLLFRRLLRQPWAAKDDQWQCSTVEEILDSTCLHAFEKCLSKQFWYVWKMNWWVGMHCHTEDSRGRNQNAKFEHVSKC